MSQLVLQNKFKLVVQELITSDWLATATKSKVQQLADVYKEHVQLQNKMILELQEQQEQQLLERDAQRTALETHVADLNHKLENISKAALLFHSTTNHVTQQHGKPNAQYVETPRYREAITEPEPFLRNTETGDDATHAFAKIPTLALEKLSQVVEEEDSAPTNGAIGGEHAPEQNVDEHEVV